MAISRRGFLKAALNLTGATVVSGSGLGLYGNKIGAYEVEFVERTITCPTLPSNFSGLTIIQISDIHLGGWMPYEHLIDSYYRINEAEPDLIFITGDFVTVMNPTVADEIISSLKLLRAKMGVYAVLGNHDHWKNAQMVGDAVRASGTTLLINEHIVFERDGQRIYLAGVDDIWVKRHDLDAALNGIEDEAFVILMAHEPDYADEVAADGRVALQLSGHTHGGQVRIPAIGAPFLPLHGEKYDDGYYKIKDLQLYVNRGLGMTIPYVRIGCPAEITHLTLQI